MDLDGLDPDPFAVLRAWFEATPSLREIEMVVATATPDGHPSARVVLLRAFDERGLVFYTNRESRKARELAANPRAAAVIHWRELGRQVRVEGTVEEVARDESETYWRTRPRGSQVAAWASPQSRPLSGREELDARVAETAQRFGNDQIQLPELWGGYRIVPDAIELWGHREDRLHDRIAYRRTASGWERERLAP